MVSEFHLKGLSVPLQAVSICEETCTYRRKVKLNFLCTRPHELSRKICLRVAKQGMLLVCVRSAHHKHDYSLAS